MNTRKPSPERRPEKSPAVAVVKKYANRRLYNTATSSYVTLDELSHMVRRGENFVVFDAKSGDDITRSVLTQIILEEDSKGRNLLPIGFLRQLISFYDDQLHAFVPRYLELSMESFARNQEQMAANRTQHDGVPRGGPALLGGLVRCGHCGRRMSLAYHDNGHEARYQCCQVATTFGGPRCQSVSARPVDGLVAELILAALAPSAIEVSLQLAEDVELERAERQQRWTQRLERAHYETALARRRYEVVDPEMRLVARTLERDWEAALGA